jgi:hypothetical protein
MLVAEREDCVRFVTQPAHAAVAGQFAEAWGGRFEPLTPRGAVVAAAYNHDNGWFEYDRRPHRDEDGALIDFRSVSPNRWISFYEDGIDGVADLDPYAGLLASLHGSGLRQRRYGLAGTATSETSRYDGFIEPETQRQRDLVENLLAEDDRLTTAGETLLRTLHEHNRAEETGSRLWRNDVLL